MDNSNDLNQSLFATSESSIPSQMTYSSSLTDDNGGFMNTLKNVNITTWLIIILILAFLGFNIFQYLASGTETVNRFLAPLLKNIFGITIGVTSQAVDVTAEGAKQVVSGTAGVIEKGLTAVQEITPTNSVGPTNMKGSNLNTTSQSSQVSPPTKKEMNSILNTTSKNLLGQDYEAQEASSSIHNVGERGWCYIGEDRGFRTCSEVGVNDTCMSGDIFPSREICMNPNLRA
jgi:hypothetical protein